MSGAPLPGTGVPEVRGAAEGNGPATVLVTGAGGCLGAWTIRHLLDQGHRPVAFDLSPHRSRIEALLDPHELASVTFVQGDIGDKEQVIAAVTGHQVERIVHLAALQVPLCRANPSLGARVNVQGTVNVFEAARAAGIGHLAYASSIAVYGSATDYPAGIVGDDAAKSPRTLYGVTKIANEGMARVYWSDHAISSVALRPYTVYGVGRDQGVTSEPSMAMLAAARGESSTISFSGRMQFHWASDVARQFIDAAFGLVAPLADGIGARVFDLGGPLVGVDQVAALIERMRPGVKVGVGDGRLPFPEGFDDAPLRAAARTVYETPLEEGVRLTLEAFEALAQRL